MRRTPFQVYLDPRDRQLLDQLARRHGLSMAETVRAAIQRWALESRDDDQFLALIGTMDDPDLPPDLSTRHHE